MGRVCGVETPGEVHQNHEGILMHSGPLCTGTSSPVWIGLVLSLLSRNITVLCWCIAVTWHHSYVWVRVRPVPVGDFAWK